MPDRRLHRLRQDLRVLRRLFPWRTTALLLFAIVVMAWLFQLIYTHDLDQPLTYIQAVYAVLNMIFFQVDYTDVPADPNLTPFFVLAPIVGLGLFSLAGFNLLQVLRVFFVRRERGQSWQEALAATYREHVVVCGLGSIGYRVAQRIAELGRPVVGVELAQTELTDELMDADLPVILGDVRRREVLEKGGVERAAIVVVCTDRDMANIEAAFHVRELNPHARLVLRIFDDEIAQSVAAAGAGFQVDAVLSRSAIAALTFAHAAAGAPVLESFRLGEQDYVLAQLALKDDSALVGRPVGEVTHDLDVTVAFLCRGGALVNEPAPDTLLQPQDNLFLFGVSDRLTALAQGNGEKGAGFRGHAIVCGLGHVGYRTASILQGLGYEVTALEREPSRLGEVAAGQGVAVQVADFRRRSVLLGAGVAHAQAIVICSDDDMLNLETGLRVRELNPDIRIVMRIFEEELGRHIGQAFGVDAVYSTSALAAPAFVGAALKVRLAQTVSIGAKEWALARLTVDRRSALAGCALADLHAEVDLTVVLHAHGDRIDVPPRLDQRLGVGDQVVLLVTPERLRRLNP
jgi:Trk K+ transport system NAD-binding subunit